MKTREELEELKSKWKKDGCWNIYETEGFEDYRNELEIFQKNCEEEAKEKAIKSHDELASKLCPMKFSYRGDCSCMVEKCAWWNGYKERCAIAFLSELDAISDGASTYTYLHQER